MADAGGQLHNLGSFPVTTLRSIANHGTHTGMYYGWLEGLSPNISFHPGMLAPPGYFLMSTPEKP